MKMATFTGKAWVSDFSVAAGQKNGQSDRKRNSEKANIEYRIMNIECRSNEFCLFYKKMTELPVGSQPKATCGVASRGAKPQA